MKRSPLKIIPLAFVDKTHLMVLSNRVWRPEPGWCQHDWRTYVMTAPDDRTKGIRFHGQAEDFGVLIETKPRCLPIDAPRQRRRPDRERRAKLTPRKVRTDGTSR